MSISIKDLTPEAQMILGRVEEAKQYFKSKEQILEYIAAPDELKNLDEMKELGFDFGWKKCGRCGKAKKYFLFSRNKGSATGCAGNCKECQKATSKKHYDANKGKTDHKGNYARNREARQEYSRKYYQKNKTKMAAKHRSYRQSTAGKKVMQQAHAKRQYALMKNAGIPWTKEMIVDRDTIANTNGTRPLCILCDKPIEHDRDIHMEHLIPVVLGGQDCFTNVACAHALCNLQKTKDAKEIQTEQVDTLIKRSEEYMETHPDLFKGFMDQCNLLAPKNEIAKQYQVHSIIKEKDYFYY